MLRALGETLERIAFERVIDEEKEEEEDEEMAEYRSRGVRDGFSACRLNQVAGYDRRILKTTGSCAPKLEEQTFEALQSLPGFVIVTPT